MRPMFGALRARRRRRRSSRSSRSARSSEGSVDALRPRASSSSAVRGCRGIGKRDMRLNDALPRDHGRSRDLRGARRRRAPRAASRRRRAAAGAALLPVLDADRLSRGWLLAARRLGFPDGRLRALRRAGGGGAARASSHGQTSLRALRRASRCGRPATARCRSSARPTTAPDALGELDALCDAFLSSHVANRASRTQGRAFARHVRAHLPAAPRSRPLRARARAPRASRAHHAPIFGASLRALGVDRARRAALFLYLALRGVAVGGGAPRRRRSARGAAPAARARAPRSTRCSTHCATLRRATTSPRPRRCSICCGATHDRLYSRLFQS